MSEFSWLILLTGGLTAVSLFFSLNNLALKTFSRVKLQEAFEALGKKDDVDELVENAEKLILTCSFFRIITNVAILFVLVVLFTMGHYILPFIIAVVIFGIFSLAIPYSWAKYTGESILPKTYKLLNFFSYPATPVLLLFNLHDRIVRRLAGVTQTSPDQTQEEKQEEILSFVEQGKIEGVVDAEELEMIENVLELDETTAEEIMTPRTDLVAVNVKDDLRSILKTITTAGHSRIPVYEDNIDKIIGLVYAKDLLGQIGKKPEQFNLHDKMRKPYFVPETKPLRVLLHEFQNQKLHIAVVLDEYGGTAGLVTIEDILEELVGEIVDEYEKHPPATLKKIDETTIEIDARMYIDDLNSEFELNLPEDEDYDTVGGFVFSHLGYIPKTGEGFEYDHVKFKITAAEARRIKRIRIQKPAEQKNNNQ